MQDLQVGLNITPSSAPANAPSFTATVTLTYSGPAPTGTLTLMNGSISYSATVAVSGASQQVAGTISNAVAGGAYLIQAVYSGDSNYNNEKSLAFYFQITAAQPSTQGTQAVARVTCVAVQGPAPARTDRENGVYAPLAYSVSSIAMVTDGSGQYDSNTVATLTGTVAGTFTRQTLTVALDGNGGISGLSGFDSSTAWDAPPKLTISRWDGTSASANYLGS